MMKERIPWIRARRQAAGKQIMIPPDGPELKKLKIAARERFMSLAAPWIERFENPLWSVSSPVDPEGYEFEMGQLFHDHAQNHA